MEVSICESLFRRQSEVTRQVVEGIGHTHVCMKEALRFIVSARIQASTEHSTLLSIR